MKPKGLLREGKTFGTRRQIPNSTYPQLKNVTSLNELKKGQCFNKLYTF